MIMKLTKQQFYDFTYADVVNGDVLFYGKDANRPMLRTTFTSVSDLEAALKRPLVVCEDDYGMSLHSIEGLISDIVLTLGEDSYVESMEHIDQIAVKLDQTHAEVYGLILNDFQQWLKDNPIWFGAEMTRNNLDALKSHSKPLQLGL